VFVQASTSNAVALGLRHPPLVAPFLASAADVQAGTPLTAAPVYDIS